VGGGGGISLRKRVGKIEEGFLLEVERRDPRLDFFTE
jgi:hypothetical protein